MKVLRKGTREERKEKEKEKERVERE